MERIAMAVAGLRDVATRFGPYILLEAVMPGGTLMAVALYLHRRYRNVSPGAFRTRHSAFRRLPVARTGGAS